MRTLLREHQGRSWPSCRSRRTAVQLGIPSDAAQRGGDVPVRGPAHLRGGHVAPTNQIVMEPKPGGAAPNLPCSATRSVRGSTAEASTATVPPGLRGPKPAGARAPTRSALRSCLPDRGLTGGTGARLLARPSQRGQRTIGWGQRPRPPSSPSSGDPPRAPGRDREGRDGRASAMERSAGRRNLHEVERARRTATAPRTRLTAQVRVQAVPSSAAISTHIAFLKPP